VIKCLLRASSFVLFHLSILYCTYIICCYFLENNDWASWIGANDKRREGRWRWISDRSRLVYSNWGRHEPNNKLGEDCGQIYKEFDGYWNDAYWDEKHGYICEKNDD